MRVCDVCRSKEKEHPAPSLSESIFQADIKFDSMNVYTLDMCVPCRSQLVLRFNDALQKLQESRKESSKVDYSTSTQEGFEDAGGG